MSSPAKESSPEPAEVEQVITEFFAKSLHIILESRSPYVSSRDYHCLLDFFASSPSPTPSPSSSASPSPSSSQPRDRWFNLALRHCPAALENFDLWRQSNVDPLVLDIVLLSASPPSQERKIIERWVIKYESRRIAGRPGRTSHSAGNVYKYSTILLRSLYLIVRMLPAYALFRDLNSSSLIGPRILSHRISSSVVPLTTAEGAEMRHFHSNPIETPCGRLSLSVFYLPAPSLEQVACEVSSQMSVDLIPSYVGSPLAAPFKAMTITTVPGDAPVTRRHSWSDARTLQPLLAGEAPGNLVRAGSAPVGTTEEDICRAVVLASPPKVISFDATILAARRPFSGDSKKTRASKVARRLCMHDDADDAALVFAGEIDDRGTKSSLAAVGALVRLLRTAPALRCQGQFQEEDRGSPSPSEEDESSSPVPLRPRTAADALEELRQYRGMRQALLTGAGGTSESDH